MNLLPLFDQVFQLEDAKKLLRPDWRLLNKSGPHSTGFCYIAAEACYHLLGGKSANLKIYYASYTEKDKKYTHWWLKQGDTIIDPTASQYTELGKIPPYHLGKCSGFLTLKPSKKAVKLMEMVRNFFIERIDIDHEKI